MDAELWDLVDAAGRPLGITHRRGDPDLPAGSYHIVSSVCAVREDGRVLISQRAAVKDFALDWEFAAGSALAGETSREAAARELREETGLIAAADALVFVGRRIEATALFDVYVAHDIDPATVQLDPAEVADSEWVTMDEVRERYRAGVFAAPWVARFDELWPALTAAVRAGAATR
ncbi:NUDIX hydrolase [Microbacterium sp. NEAU-LLC]|uniref:NUDIX hydrolase n=1 Tax=Microbacterium helvum TaxID=2773713 RepID=A0ABR8NP66_9MICO|nr:NUDIX hydrolase [Microbacterium helvum]MBD3942440.1 NUDIX hydrolase [Microbacterium helvum]